MEVIKNQENLWVLEYSHLQDAFNIQPLFMAVNANRSDIYNDFKNDYKIVGIFETYEEASREGEYLRDTVGYRGIYSVIVRKEEK